MSYKGIYLNPFKESYVGKAILLDLSPEAYRIYEVLYDQITNPMFIMIFFSIAVVMTWLSDDAPVFLIGRCLRFLLVSNITWFFCIVMLELGCGLADLLVTEDNYLLRDMSATLKQMSSFTGNVWNDFTSLNLDITVLPKTASKIGYFILTQVLVRFGMFAVGASFSLIYFFGLIASLLACLLSILPNYSKNWKYSINVGMWGFITPVVVVCITQLCSFIFKAKSIVGDSVGFAHILFMLLFIFYIFGAFKLAQSIIKGEGVGEAASAMGMSAMTGYATGLAVKAASIGKAPLTKMATFLKGQDMKISSFADKVREQAPRKLHDVATGSLSRGKLGPRESLARTYDNIRHPMKAIDRVRAERGITKDVLNQNGMSSSSLKRNGLDDLKSVENMSFTPLQRERMSSDISRDLFDQAMTNGRPNPNDSYVHDISKWDSYDADKKIELSNRFNVGENSKNGHVYYPKDWGVESNSIEKHKSTMESINKFSDYIDSESYTDQNDRYDNVKSKIKRINRGGNNVRL